MNRTSQKRNMKVICIINNKGGVGKSASAIIISHILATVYEKKVLGIDLDPQGNFSNLYNDIDIISILTSMLKGTSSGTTEYSVEDLLVDSTLDIHECIKKTDYENLDIIPAFLTLSEVEEQLKADIRTPQQFRLKNHLMKIKDEYDYCIIDCSPSISIVNINGLAATDEVYIPMRCDAWSAIGMCITKNLIDTVKTYNPTLQEAGCFFTQWDGRKNVSNAVYQLLNELVPDKLLPIKIRVSKNIEEMSFTKEPLIQYESGKAKSNAAKDYILLVEYILSENRKSLIKKIKGER